MKNIHILPTDKPSRLSCYFQGKLLFDKEKFHKTFISQHIYITSDEQPKHNDYYTTDGKEIYYCNTLNPTRNNHYKKVILTTDSDLIADGVQAIDDEFLEWFVKNPSCESVEVEKRFSDFTVEPFIGYEIIIPQEEPKQDSNKTHHLDELPNVDKDVVSKMYNAAIPKLEPKQDYKPNSCDIIFETAALIENKQETIEEAARKWYSNTKLFDKGELNAFIAGANWQADRMYSEEEQLNLLNNYNEYLFTFIDKDVVGIGVEKEDVIKWFEQFKKI